MRVEQLRGVIPFDQTERLEMGQYVIDDDGNRWRVTGTSDHGDGRDCYWVEEVRAPR